jgi:hypothetical protein
LNAHRFLRRIPLWPAARGVLYISTTRRLAAIDLKTDTIRWEKSYELPAQPRWIAFSRDGRYASPSTGDVIDAASKKIVGALEAPAGMKNNSANVVEIDFPPL